jgi:hypothetical protein
MDGWMEKAIQFDTNWRMGSLFFNQDMKANPSKQKADTNKSNGNARWWRTNERKDPNAMDVDASTMEERGTLLRQGKCFCCRKTGHMAKNCPPRRSLNCNHNHLLFFPCSHRQEKTFNLAPRFEVVAIYSPLFFRAFLRPLSSLLLLHTLSYHIIYKCPQKSPGKRPLSAEHVSHPLLLRRETQELELIPSLQSNRTLVSWML